MPQPAQNALQNDPGLHGADKHDLHPLRTNQDPLSSPVDTSTTTAYAGPGMVESVEPRSSSTLEDLISTMTDQAPLDVLDSSVKAVATSSSAEGKGIQIFPFYVRQH
jgi:hypothetical protein